jgi:hypothetical protein
MSDKLTPLGLATDDELLDEIEDRFDVFVFAGELTLEDERTETTFRHNSEHWIEAIGLASLLLMKIERERWEAQMEDAIKDGDA